LEYFDESLDLEFSLMSIPLRKQSLKIFQLGIFK
jgi:hypothetical protein